jgi:hypothetical protein
MIAALAVGGVLMLAMIAASARGAVRLAPDARIGVHCGSVEHCFFVSKRAGLIIWPAMGAVLFVVLGGITKSSLAAGWVPGVRDVLVPAVLFDLPRAFRTAYLRLIYAADCCSRYSSWTCRGLRY